MSNRLQMATIQAILSLRAQRWSYRRIARELGIHRETVARYVGLVASKPAKAPLGNGEVSDAPKPASEAPLGALAEGEAPTDSCTVGQDLVQLIQGAERSVESPGRRACEPWREVILLKLGVGLLAQRTYLDLTTEHGYAGSYYSVKRFVRRLAG